MGINFYEKVSRRTKAEKLFGKYIGGITQMAIVKFICVENSQFLPIEIQCVDHT
jgi:hypothetical protein